MTKYIFVTGGVVSSLGKGITAASIGRLLINRGLSIRMLKIDPYLNVDPGTMSPYQHGEVYVTDDGAETDLDLGHYERYTGTPTSNKSNITAGRMYWEVLEKERKGDYLGGTVQMIPHITDHIKSSIRSLESPDVDIILAELGGTVGDIEGLVILETLRQIGFDIGRKNTLYMHLTYVPFIAAAGEIKTKPTQQSVAKLREIGIIPDMLVCRTERKIEDDVRKKIALFCNVCPEHVIEEMDVEKSVYEVPLMLADQGVDDLVLDHFGIDRPMADMTVWKEMIQRIYHPKGIVRIGLVGKYDELQDAYKSIRESLYHGGLAHEHKTQIVKIAAEKLEKGDAEELLKDVDGILIPGGFGHRGVEGKIKAAAYARENKVPFLGICLGLQCAVIEFCRNVCGLEDAHSVEFDDFTEHKVVALMEDQKKVTNMGGTMRLGAWDCEIVPGTRAAKAYGELNISERHRHRYEVNSAYCEEMENCGLTISGINPQSGLVEMIELPNHPWFVATQAHPEFKSQPLKPHPLFRDFIGAAIEHAKDSNN